MTDLRRQRSSRSSSASSRSRSRRRRRASGIPNGSQQRLTLVFDTETTTDVRQELRFGIAQVYSNGRLLRTMLVTGDLSPKERETASMWAAAHKAKVLTVSEFVTQEFLPLTVDGRAVVVGFNLPFDLARIAADWEPKRKVAGKRAWTLSLHSPVEPQMGFRSEGTGRARPFGHVLHLVHRD